MLAYFGITVSMCQQCWYKELTISKCNRRYIDLSQATYQSANPKQKALNSKGGSVNKIETS